MQPIKYPLRKAKRIANRIFGTKVDEVFWKFRHFFDSSWAQNYIVEESVSHRHRALLVKKISFYHPFEEVLELGCASGPNLFLLAKKFPQSKFYGIDISKNAVRVGTDFFKKERLNNIFLKTGKVNEIEKMRQKSVDLVFTDAVLIYQGPEKIESILKNMIRVAKKAIVLCEQFKNSGTSFYKDHWIHDYKSLLIKIVPQEKIKITKINPEVWPGDWGKMGHIIEVAL